VQDLVFQLLDQGLLRREEGEYPTLHLTDAAWPVLRGQQEAPLLDPQREGKPVQSTGADPWAGVDRQLFERLRELRRSLAQQREVPPYVILGDAPLRSLAMQRPSTLEGVSAIRGIGEKKLSEFGQTLVDTIREHCQQFEVTMDVDAGEAQEVVPPSNRTKRPNPKKEQAMGLFAEGQSIEAVAEAIGRARSTCSDYLVQYIEAEKPQQIRAWVSDDDYQRIVQAISKVPSDRLRPVYDQLNGELSFDTIKIVLTHHRVTIDDAEA
jgi:ATP-dependent DNA helicase RecQ